MSSDPLSFSFVFSSMAFILRKSFHIYFCMVVLWFLLFHLMLWFIWNTFWDMVSSKNLNCFLFRFSLPNCFMNNPVVAHNFSMPYSYLIYFVNQKTKRNKTNQTKEPQTMLLFWRRKDKAFGPIDRYCCVPGTVLRTLHITAHFLFPTTLCSKHFSSPILQMREWEPRGTILRGCSLPLS